MQHTGWAVWIWGISVSKNSFENLVLLFFHGNHQAFIFFVMWTAHFKCAPPADRELDLCIVCGAASAGENEV